MGGRESIKGELSPICFHQFFQLFSCQPVLPYQGICDLLDFIFCLELKAYDYMLRFEKSFNGFETVGNAWAFLDLCCKACAVELAHTQAEIEVMPNGTELFSIGFPHFLKIFRRERRQQSCRTCEVLCQVIPSTS